MRQLIRDIPKRKTRTHNGGRREYQFLLGFVRYIELELNLKELNYNLILNSLFGKNVISK